MGAVGVMSGQVPSQYPLDVADVPLDAVFEVLRKIDVSVTLPVWQRLRARVVTAPLWASPRFAFGPPECWACANSNMGFVLDSLSARPMNRSQILADQGQ